MGLIKPIGTIDKAMTKMAIVRMANEHAHQIIESGNYDLLKTYVEMKRYELYIKTIINKLKAISTLQAQVMREEDRRAVAMINSEAPGPATAGVLPATTPLDTEVTDEHPVVRRNTIQYATASVQITKKSTYDFTQDAEWQRLTNEISRLKVELKQREEFLRNQTNIPVQQSENILVRL